MVCGTEFLGEEPQVCCSGRECGCMGMPIDPIICSEKCYNELIDNRFNRQSQQTPIEFTEL